MSNKTKLRINIFLILSILGINNVNAVPSMNNPSNDFQSFLNYASSLKGTVRETTKTFKPEEHIKDYNPNPDQAKYYGGVTKGNDQDLKNAVLDNIAKDELGKTVIDSSKTNPVFPIDPAAPGMKKSEIIQNDSYNISRGISDKYVDCKAVQDCKTTYTTQNCNEQVRTLVKSCIKIPNVTIVKEPYKVTTTSSGGIWPWDLFKGPFTSPIDGEITSFDTNLYGIFLDSLQPYYSYLLGTYVSTVTPQEGYRLIVLHFHNDQLHIPVSKNQTITFSYKGPLVKVWLYSNYSITFTETKYKKTAQVTWVENCKDDS